MKFTVASKPLTTVASAVSRIINNKSSMMILNDFLFDIHGETLTISAGDGENFIWGRVKIDDVEGEGRLCIPAKGLVDLLKAMPEQEMRFSVNDETRAINMTHPNGTYDFMGEDATSFPTPKEPVAAEGVEPVEFECDGAKLLRDLTIACVGVATDTIRPQMTGVCVDIRADRVVFVSTDTHKLVKMVDNSMKSETEGVFIVPSRTVNIFNNVFTSDENVKVRFIQDQGVRFESDTYCFDSRLVKGRFPDYDRVIPKNNELSMSVDRGLFTNAVRRVGVFVNNSDSGLIKMKMEPEKVTMKTVDNSYNTLGIETVACEFNAPQGLIGFKFNYLMDVLGVMWTERVIMKIKDQSRPAMILPEENHPESELTILLMPMNMGEF